MTFTPMKMFQVFSEELSAVDRPVIEGHDTAGGEDDDADVGRDCLRVVGRKIIEHHEIIDDF